MIRWSFLAIAGPAAARERLIERIGLAARLRAEGLEVAPGSAALTLFTTPDTPRLSLPAGGGAILGRLYRSSASAPECIHQLRDSEVEAIATLGPKCLIDDYWGSYVALLSGGAGEGCTILRDPSAAIPLYHAEVDGARLCVSEPDLLLRLGLVEPCLDSDFQRQWLLYRHLRTARTGLAAIRELLPGTSLSVGSGGAAVKPCWTPWRFTDRRERLGSFEEAASSLRRTALGTIPAYAAGADKVLLELSGGLDSSIIASSLANAGTRFAAVNFVTRSADGDERRYARMVAAKTGAPLVEVPQSDSVPDLRRLPPPLVRPGLSAVLEPIHGAFAAVAQDLGADMYMSGAGGDSVFCYLTTAAPAIDAARAMGLSAALRTLSDVSQLCGCTYWTAARFAWRKAWRRRPPAWEKELSFLTPAAASGVPDPHPWLADPPDDVLPGSRQHVEAIVTVLYFLDRGFRGREAAITYPLMAQPLVELCLRIPTWMWIRNGRNRAVARRAYDDLVPAPILARGGKGRLESMCADAYARSRADLRSLLLEGRLAADGLIDRAAVDAFLRQEVDRSDVRYFRVLDLATLELWLAAWRSRPAMSRAP